jgi:hypothetical protein
MRRVVFLDTGILGMVTNPRKYPEVRAWLQRLGTAGIEVWVPESPIMNFAGNSSGGEPG